MGWCDLTKVEGTALKPRIYFKSLWTFVREAIYWYKLTLPLKKSFIQYCTQSVFELKLVLGMWRFLNIIVELLQEAP